MAERPLTIGMVCYPSFGGSGVVATELGQALADRGHTVHFICYNLPARLRRLSSKVHFHPVDVVTYPLFQFPPYTLALATRLADVIRETNLDLVHVHYAIPHSLSAQLARDMTGREDLPIITTLHGTDVQLVGLDRSYRGITKYSMERCCGLTAVSRYLAETTRREFELEKPIEVIPNFVDLARFRRARRTSLRRRLAPGGERIVCHISNFRAVKRTLHVIKAFRRILRKVPAVLVMIGDGPDRPVAEKLADSLGISSRVRFIPFVPGVQAYLSIADLFLFPSVMESFGLAALEAMASEVPVVCYRVGGLPEVLGPDGETGRLVEPGDWIRMGRLGTEILSDPDMAASMGAAGRRRAAALFSQDEVVGRYEEYYRRQLESVTR